MASCLHASSQLLFSSATSHSNTIPSLRKCHSASVRACFCYGKLQNSSSSVRSRKSSRSSVVVGFFNFGRQPPKSVSKSRDDFDRTDVEEYFNYMGMLAVEGTYDKMEALLKESIHPVDILLLLAASEGDKPKIEELLQAGADCTITDVEGKTAIDRAVDDETRDLIAIFSKQN